MARTTTNLTFYSVSSIVWYYTELSRPIVSLSRYEIHIAWFHNRPFIITASQNITNHITLHFPSPIVTFPIQQTSSPTVCTLTIKCTWFTTSMSPIITDSCSSHLLSCNAHSFYNSFICPLNVAVQYQT